MTATFRVIDTGIREGRANIAIDAAMIELHAANVIPDSIRFIQFPPTALIGRHQSLSQEIDIDYCHENGIGIARRLTGGGAIYFDEGQLGWSLVFKRGSLGISSLEELTRAICEAAAAGLSALGIDARYRPRNDIEVDGRKISGTGGFFDGDTLFYQGTVLVDMKASNMLSALRVPAAKLVKRNLDSAANRIVTLKELLGNELPDLERVKSELLAGFRRELAVETNIGAITEAEEQHAAEIYAEEVGQDEFVAEIDAPTESAETTSGTHHGRGGTIICYLRREGPRQNRIREILFTGDFFVTPPRLVYDLEASLRGVELNAAPAKLRTFFDDADVDMLSVTPNDFLCAFDNALSNAQTNNSP